MREYRKVESIRGRKISSGRSVNENMLCFTNEQEAETAVIK